MQHFWTKLQESINYEVNLKFLYDLIQIQKNSTNNLFDSKLLDSAIISNLNSYFKIDYDQFRNKKTLNYYNFLDRLINLSKMFLEYLIEIINIPQWRGVHSSSSFASTLAPLSSNIFTNSTEFL